MPKDEDGHEEGQNPKDEEQEFEKWYDENEGADDSVIVELSDGSKITTDDLWDTFTEKKFLKKLLTYVIMMIVFMSVGFVIGHNMAMMEAQIYAQKVLIAYCMPDFVFANEQNILNFAQPNVSVNVSINYTIDWSQYDLQNQRKPEIEWD